MGGMQAPPELWMGVGAQLIADKLDDKLAPEQLWDGVRVQLEDDGLAAKETKMFSLRPVYAAAAALLMVIGAAFQLDWMDEGANAFMPELAPVVSVSTKAEILARVSFIEVQPHEMSSTARTLAAALGGTTVEVTR